MTASAEPDPAVLEAVAQLARDLPHVDADEAWARLAHLTPEQRAVVERAVDGVAAITPEHGQGRAMATRDDGQIDLRADA